MASLDLKLEGSTGTPGQEAKKSSSIISTLNSKFSHGTPAYKATGTSAFSIDKVFVILRDLLQPDTTLSLESAAESVLALLPEKAPLSTEIWSFGEVCFELSEQIPYHHPSQLKLARLLEYIGRSTKVNDKMTSKGKADVYNRYQRLGESKRDWYNGPEPENPDAWVNYNAFLANLQECRVWNTDPTYAIWTLRDALETNQDEDAIRDCNVLAAAQWILWNGQSLFKQILFSGDVSSDDLRTWGSGPLYDGKGILSLHRWQFWRERFRVISIEDGVSDECKSVAGRAADLMVSIESNLTF